jgi:hypothetical protein
MNQRHIPFECLCGHMLDEHRDSLSCLMPECACVKYEARVAFKAEDEGGGP